MKKDDLAVGAYFAAICAVIGFGFYLEATGQDTDRPMPDVPPSVEFGDGGYEPAYEREWGK